MVGESQRRRICKYCNKSFPSGKSLGGHVRSHVMGCGLTQNPKKIRRLSDVDDRVQMELQDVAVVLMMLSRDDASAGAAAAEESSSRNSGVVEECEQYEEDWDMSRRRRRRRRRKSRPAGHPTDRDFSYGGDHWEEAAVELIGNKNGGPKGRRGSDDWYEPEKTQNSKRSRFQCNTCKKVFCTYQALGGHRAAHKRTKGPCYVPDADANEDEEGNHEVEVEAQISGAHAPPDRKAIRYQCPACLKVFASGQALGGHKRSHVAVNCSDAEATDILFDLNAPALGDGNSSITNAQAGTVPCPVGRNSTAKCPAGGVGEGK